MANKFKLDSLQLFRGIASLGVVVKHTAISVNAFAIEEIPGFLYWFLSKGFLGVDFFFVLSGFIILNSHFDDKRSFSASKVYFLKRLIRIFPPYLPISITLLAAYTLLPNLSAGTRSDLSIISSIFLLPSNNPPALSVAWTLIHEMVFYFFFLVFFLGSRVFLVLSTGWVFSIIVLYVFFSGEFENPFLSVFFNVINLEFSMGMLCAYLWKRYRPTKLTGLLLVSLGGVIFAILMTVDTQHRVLFGIPFSLMVLGGAYLDLNKQIKIPKIGVLAGDASYSIYLIHNPLLSITSRIARRVELFSNWGGMLLFGVLTSILAGLFYYKFIELKLTQLAKKTFLREAR